jgi:hypothetical protein
MQELASLAESDQKISLAPFIEGAVPVVPQSEALIELLLISAPAHPSLCHVSAHAGNPSLLRSAKPPLKTNSVVLRVEGWAPETRQ